MVGIAPGVSAWSCAACSTDWAISRVGPQSCGDRLAAAAQRLGFARSILRDVSEVWAADVGGTALW